MGGGMGQTSLMLRSYGKMMGEQTADNGQDRSSLKRPRAGLRHRTQVPALSRHSWSFRAWGKG